MVRTLRAVSALLLVLAASLFALGVDAATAPKHVHICMAHYVKRHKRTLHAYYGTGVEAAKSANSAVVNVTRAIIGEVKVSGSAERDLGAALVSAEGRACDMLVGTGTSAAVQAVNLLVATPWVDYSATASILGDKGQFPFFSRVVPSDAAGAAPLAALAKKFGWAQLTAICAEDTYSLSVVDGLARGIRNASEGVQGSVASKCFNRESTGAVVEGPFIEFIEAQAFQSRVVALAMSGFTPLLKALVDVIVRRRLYLKYIFLFADSACGSTLPGTTTTFTPPTGAAPSTTTPTAAPSEGVPPSGTAVFSPMMNEKTDMWLHVPGSFCARSDFGTPRIVSYLERYRSRSAAEVQYVTDRLVELRLPRSEVDVNGTGSYEVFAADAGAFAVRAAVQYVQQQRAAGLADGTWTWTAEAEKIIKMMRGTSLDSGIIMEDGVTGRVALEANGDRDGAAMLIFNAAAATVSSSAGSGPGYTLKSVTSTANVIAHVAHASVHTKPADVARTTTALSWAVAGHAAGETAPSNAISRPTSSGESSSGLSTVTIAVLAVVGILCLVLIGVVAFLLVNFIRASWSKNIALRDAPNDPSRRFVVLFVANLNRSQLEARAPAVAHRVSSALDDVIRASAEESRVYVSRRLDTHWMLAAQTPQQALEFVSSFRMQEQNTDWADVSQKKNDKKAANASPSHRGSPTNTNSATVRNANASATGIESGAPPAVPVKRKRQARALTPSVVISMWYGRGVVVKDGETGYSYGGPIVSNAAVLADLGFGGQNLCVGPLVAEVETTGDGMGSLGVFRTLAQRTIVPPRSTMPLEESPLEESSSTSMSDTSSHAPHAGEGRQQQPRVSILLTSDASSSSLADLDESHRSDGASRRVSVEDPSKSAARFTVHHFAVGSVAEIKNHALRRGPLDATSPGAKDRTTPDGDDDDMEVADSITAALQEQAVVDGLAVRRIAVACVRVPDLAGISGAHQVSLAGAGEVVNSVSELTHRFKYDFVSFTDGCAIVSINTTAKTAVSQPLLKACDFGLAVVDALSDIGVQAYVGVAAGSGVAGFVDGKACVSSAAVSTARSLALSAAVAFPSIRVVAPDSLLHEAACQFVLQTVDVVAWPLLRKPNTNTGASSPPPHGHRRQHVHASRFGGSTASPHEVHGKSQEASEIEGRGSLNASHRLSASGSPLPQSGTPHATSPRGFAANGEPSAFVYGPLRCLVGVMGAVAIDEDEDAEWLYQLDRTVAATPFTAANDAFAATIAGDMSAASALVELKSSDGEPRVSCQVVSGGENHGGDGATHAGVDRLRCIVRSIQAGPMGDITSPLEEDVPTPSVPVFGAAVTQSNGNGNGNTNGNGHKGAPDATGGRKQGTTYRVKGPEEDVVLEAVRAYARERFRQIALATFGQ